MTAARKVKLSVTLSRDLVERIDREAGGAGARSRVIEQWLRQAARMHAERDLERATIAYYESLTDEERAEDDAISSAMGRAGRRLDIDGTGRAQRRRPRAGQR